MSNNNNTAISDDSKVVYEVGFYCKACDFTMHGYVMHPYEALKKHVNCLYCKKTMKNLGVTKKITGEKIIS